MKIRKKKKTSENNQSVYLLVISLMIILPFTYTKTTLDTTLAIKTIVLNISLLILFIIFYFEVIKRNQDLKFLQLMIFPIFLAYFTISILSLTNAINLSIGYHDLIKTFLSLVLLIIATYFFQKNNDFKTILSKASVLTLAISTSFGIYQYYMYAYGKSEEELFEALYMVKGIMAHKNLYAISLFMLLPFSIFGCLQFKKWWFIISLYAFAISLIMITLLQTRSVWIATALFVLVSGILIVLIRRKIGFDFSKLRIKKAYYLVFFIIVILISVIIYKSPSFRNLIVYKALSVLDIKSDNNQGRLDIWESTIEMSKENIILGVGAGNWRIHFPKYYSDKQGDKYKNWVQPHNDFLWILSEKGIFGLLTHLLIYIFAIVYCIRILIKSNRQDELIFTLLMMSMIISYIILSLFTFPYKRINHQIILMMIFSAIIVDYSKYSILPNKKLNIHLVKNILLLIGFGISFTLYANIKVYQSQTFVKKALDAISINNHNKVIEYTTKAYNPFYTLDYYSTPILKNRGTAYSMLKQNNKANNDILKALDDNPNNLGTLNDAAAFFARQKNYVKAIFYYNKTLLLFPNYEVGIKNLTLSYYYNNDYKNAYLTILRTSTKNQDQQYLDFLNKLKVKINTPTK